MHLDVYVHGRTFDHLDATPSSSPQHETSEKHMKNVVAVHRHQLVVVVLHSARLLSGPLGHLVAHPAFI